jgi:hypothetical protein
MKKDNYLFPDIRKTLKSILIIPLFIAIALSASAQSKADIVGNWSVQKVELSEELSLTEEQKMQMELLFSELRKSTFSFYQDQKTSIYLTLADTSKNDGYWVYDEHEKIITITDLKNKEAVLAKILVELSKDKEVKFHIASTPFILTVLK